MNRNPAAGNSGEQEAVTLRSTAINKRIDDIEHSTLLCNPPYSVSDLLQQHMVVMGGISVHQTAPLTEQPSIDFTRL